MNTAHQANHHAPHSNLTEIYPGVYRPGGGTRDENDGLNLPTGPLNTLLGDPSKAKAKLGWTPEITVQQMCVEMVAADLEDARRHSLLKSHGYSVNISVE